MQEAIQNQTTLPRPGQGAPMSHVTLAQSICLTTPQLQSKYFYGQQRSIFEMLLAGEGKTLRNKRGNGKRNLRQTDLFMVFCLVSDRNLTKLTKTYCLKYNVHSLQNNGCTWWCFFVAFFHFGFMVRLIFFLVPRAPKQGLPQPGPKKTAKSVKMSK